MFRFVFKLCKLRIYKRFEFIYSSNLYNLRINILSQSVQIFRHLLKEFEDIFTLPIPESERKERGQNWNFILEKGSKNRTRETIQKWNRKFKNILILVFNIFLRPFSVKNVVKLTEKTENILRNKNKSATIHQKKNQT